MASVSASHDALTVVPPLTPSCSPVSDGPEVEAKAVADPPSTVAPATVTRAVTLTLWAVDWASEAMV